MTTVCLAGIFGFAVVRGRQANEIDLSVPLPSCSVVQGQGQLVGQFWTQFQPFDDAAGAEGYVCHAVAYPRNLDGWHLQGIDAILNGPVPPQADLYGFLRQEEPFFWRLNLRYTLGTYSTPQAHYLSVIVTTSVAVAFDSRYVKPIPFSVGSHPARLIHYPNGSTIVTWRQDGLNYAANAQTDDDFRLADLLPILRSIR